MMALLALTIALLSLGMQVHCLVIQRLARRVIRIADEIRQKENEDLLRDARKRPIVLGRGPIEIYTGPQSERLVVLAGENS